jgi:hypothetical protein
MATANLAKRKVLGAQRILWLRIPRFDALVDMGADDEANLDAA